MSRPSARRRPWITATGVVATVLWLLVADVAAGETSTEESTNGTVEAVSFWGENLVVIATIGGTIAALPTLVEFLVERRKRRERIELSLDDVAVATVQPHCAGFDHLLAEIADLLDRAGDPAAYAGLGVGNEILILGGSLSGKKNFAQQIAKSAKLDRLITVWNPRNPDALAAAKSLLKRYRRLRVMLLLPRIDQAYEKQDEDLLSELDALIETTSELDNVSVVGTAIDFEADSLLDNAFGIKLVLPGISQPELPPREPPAEVRELLTEVCNYYLKRAKASGFNLAGLTTDELVARVLQVVTNPAEVEDIIVLCQTCALYRRRVKLERELSITRNILERSIRRVVVHVSTRIID